MTALLVVVFLALAISFLCSILEAVLLSITHSYVVVLKDRGTRAGIMLADMREHIDEPIAAILTLNTIAHTVGAAVGGALAYQVFGSEWIALFSAALTLAILVFSEILPKTLGATYWQLLAPAVTYVLRVLIVLLKPVLIPLAWFNRLISPRGDRQPKVSRAELEVLAELGRKEGTIDEEEWQVVSNVINLDQVRVDQIMTPRTRIVAVALEAGMDGAKRLFLEQGHSRLPVYGESLDDIVGVVLARDAWRAREEGVTDLQRIIRDARFVPEGKAVEDLIREMREERLNLAIVVDEYGGTAGLVTLEDLIEEIVGEIQDEHEVEPLPFQETGPGQIRIGGQVPVWEVNERFQLTLPEEPYDTIAGLMLHHLGRIARVGDEVVIGSAHLKVAAMDGRRVSEVTFVPATPAQQPPRGGT
jgi:CBS domain containing-hemolysin-like protein